MCSVHPPIFKKSHFNALKMLILRCVCVLPKKKIFMLTIRNLHLFAVNSLTGVYIKSTFNGPTNNSLIMK